MNTSRRPLPEIARGKVARNPLTGEIITAKNLPSSDTRRWVVSRKAIVVAAVDGELITEEEACERYLLSKEELDTWRELIKKEGLRGLRATYVRDYVPKPVPQEPISKHPIRASRAPKVRKVEAVE